MSAALSVHVGQFHDPIDRQGLAHFLEHMPSSGKIPTVGDYRKFIMGNGGRSNAGTGQENTTYHFEITPGYQTRARSFNSSHLQALILLCQKRARSRPLWIQFKTKDDARRYREVRRATTTPNTPFFRLAISTHYGSEMAARSQRPQTILRCGILCLENECLCAWSRNIGVLEQKVKNNLVQYPQWEGCETATVPIYTPEQKVSYSSKPHAEKKCRTAIFCPSKQCDFDHRPVEPLTCAGPWRRRLTHETLKSKGWAERLSLATVGLTTMSFLASKSA